MLELLPMGFWSSIGIFVLAVSLSCYAGQYLEKQRNIRISKIYLELSKNGFLIDLVRKVYPKMIAHELVNVQPITGNFGEIFSLKHTYTTSPQLDMFPIQPWQQILIDDWHRKAEQNRKVAIKTVS